MRSAHRGGELTMGAIKTKWYPVPDIDGYEANVELSGDHGDVMVCVKNSEMLLPRSTSRRTRSRAPTA